MFLTFPFSTHPCFLFPSFLSSLLSCGVKQSREGEIRRVLVPSRRISPLRGAWKDIVEPIVQQMGLQIRFNTDTKAVELRAGPGTYVDTLCDGLAVHTKPNQTKPTT